MISITSMRVALVDDDLFSLHLFGQQLMNMGLTHVSSFSDEEALPLEQQPDIIFLSQELNGKQSLRFLGSVKRSYPDIYIIILGSKDCTETAESFLQQGAFEYLPKELAEAAALKDILQRIAGIKVQLHTAWQRRKNISQRGQSPV